MGTACLIILKSTQLLSITTSIISFGFSATVHLRVRPRQMNKKPNNKIFPVHRVIGQYEISGTITCLPAPRPGIETAWVSFLIDKRVEAMVKHRMVEDLLRAQG